jgi:hypothetical protein
MSPLPLDEVQAKEAIIGLVRAGHEALAILVLKKNYPNYPRIKVGAAKVTLSLRSTEGYSKIVDSVRKAIFLFQQGNPAIDKEWSSLLRKLHLTVDTRG